MPSKKVTIIAKPQGQHAEDWIKGAEPPAATSPMGNAEPIASASQGSDVTPFKRLTIDIPEELHARIKSQCALRRSKMADEIRLLLDAHFSV